MTRTTTTTTYSDRPLRSLKRRGLRTRVQQRSVSYMDLMNPSSCSLRWSNSVDIPTDSCNSFSSSATFDSKALTWKRKKKHCNRTTGKVPWVVWLRGNESNSPAKWHVLTSLLALNPCSNCLLNISCSVAKLVSTGIDWSMIGISSSSIDSMEVSPRTLIPEEKTITQN